MRWAIVLLLLLQSALLAGCTGHPPVPGAGEATAPNATAPGTVLTPPGNDTAVTPVVERIRCLLDPCPTVAIPYGAEPWVAVDPENPRRALVAAMVTRFGEFPHPWIGAALTEDVGTTWTELSLPGGPNDPDSDFRDYTFAADATVVFTSDGGAIVSALLGRQTPPYLITCRTVPVCEEQYAGVTLLGLATWRSDDAGRTWQTGPFIAQPEGGPAAAEGTANEGGTVNRYPDRQAMFVDPVTSRVHVVWSYRQEGPSLLAAAWSDDDGRTWTAPQVVRGSKYGPWGAAHNGTLLLGVRDGYNGTYEILRSTDGGASWSDPILVSEFARYATSPVALWVEGERLHAAVVAPTGTPEAPSLVLRTSSDGGATWGEPSFPFGNRSPSERPLPAFAVDPLTGRGLITVYEPSAGNPETLQLQGIPFLRGATGQPFPLSVGPSDLRAAFDYSFVVHTPDGALAAWGELDENGNIRVAAAPLEWAAP